jgi:hypothetical protein
MTKAFELVTGPSVWNSEVLRGDKTWIIELSGEALDELDRAADWIVASGKSVRDIGAQDLELKHLFAEMAGARNGLRSGRRAALVRGLRVEKDTARNRAQLWALGTTVGVGVSQNLKGSYIGEVVDMSDRQASSRPFQLGGELLMHRDPIDVVGLLCVRHAKAGGLSRIASSSKIHNIILMERPDLLPYLYEGFIYHRLDEDRSSKTPVLTAHRVPVFARDGDGGVSTFFIPGPIERAACHGAAIPPKAREAIEFFVSVGKRPEVYHDMNLTPGEVQFLNNRAVLHARTHYEDHQEFERRRFMMRLWLMMPDWSAPPAGQRFYEDDDRCGGGLRLAAA